MPLKIVLFRFGAGLGFWSFNFWHRARSSIVLCKSVSADRTVMAASRILAAAAGCVIPLSFAAGSRESYWSGCMKVAIVIWHQIFSILVLVFFLMLQNRSFFALASGSGFGAAISAVIVYKKASLCKNIRCVKACSV